MRMSYRQQFKQEKDIEVGLASNWGYELLDIPTDSTSPKLIPQRPLVANITLRKFSQPIPKTQKIKQVQDEIKALENERLLREVREEGQAEEKSGVIQLMERVIEDYNHIVEHKHLNQPPPERKQQKIVTRKEEHTANLLALIEQKRKQFLSADLAQQIRLNKQIAVLYRKHNADNLSSVTLKNKNTTRQPVSSRPNINKYQSQTFQHIPHLAQTNKYHSLKVESPDLQSPNLLFKNHSHIQGQILNKFKQIQGRRYGKVTRKHSLLFQHTSDRKGNESGNSVQKSIKSPFLDQKQAQSFRQMQSKIKSNSEALQVWRAKIEDNVSPRLRKRGQLGSKEIGVSVKGKDRQQQVYQMIGKEIKVHNLEVNSNSVFAQQLKHRENQHELEKHHIFAELLRKKNNKFNRLWGTKILVKYNSQQQAKSLLRGDPEKNPSTNISSRQSARSRKHSKSVIVDKREQVGVSRGQEEIEWREEQKDEEHYWRMCKNEKINLLLKRK